MRWLSSLRDDRSGNLMIVPGKEEGWKMSEKKSKCLESSDSLNSSYPIFLPPERRGSRRANHDPERIWGRSVTYMPFSVRGHKWNRRTYVVTCPEAHAVFTDFTKMVRLATVDCAGIGSLRCIRLLGRFVNALDCFPVFFLKLRIVVSHQGRVIPHVEDKDLELC